MKVYVLVIYRRVKYGVSIEIQGVYESRDSAFLDGVTLVNSVESITDYYIDELKVQE